MGNPRLHTSLCDLLGIEFPIIQAGMGMGSSAELAVAVSNAGGLGSLGCFRRPAEDVERQLSIIRERTSQPFAVNHLVTELDETGFAMTLAAKPPVISFALGDPGELVKRAHAAGSLVVHQVTTVLQARQAVEQSDVKAYGRYFHAMLENGIYLAPSQFEAGFFSLAHTGEDGSKTISVAAEALRRLSSELLFPCQILEFHHA